MTEQLTHKDHISPYQKFPVIILTDNLMGEANIGSLFRLADAFNIEKLIFTGTPINLESNRLKKTARSTYKTVPYDYCEDPVDAIAGLKNSGYQVYALEITSSSSAIHTINFNNEKKLLLVVGNERHGISEEVLQLADLAVHIKMYGYNSSMNVAQAAGIALYEITKTLPPLPEK